MTQTFTLLLWLVWLCACHHSTAVPLVKSGGGGSGDDISVHQSSFTSNSLLTSDECAAQTAEKLSAAGAWMLGVRALHTELVQFRVAVKQSGLEVCISITLSRSLCFLTLMTTTVHQRSGLTRYVSSEIGGHRACRLRSILTALWQASEPATSARSARPGLGDAAHGECSSVCCSECCSQCC